MFGHLLAATLFIMLTSRANAKPNITVAFFSDQDGASFSDNDDNSCSNVDTSKAIVLTARTPPASFTCFNVSSLFSQGNTTGSTNGTTRFSNPEEIIDPPNRVDWLLSGLDNYEAKANYSRVWFEQNIPTSDQGEGKDGHWVVYIYAYEDCEQVGQGDPDPYLTPWFESSCQTKEGGQCETVPYPIKSFGLNMAYAYNKNHGGCKTWAYMGGATRFEARYMGLVGGMMLATSFMWL